MTRNKNINKLILDAGKKLQLQNNEMAKEIKELKGLKNESLQTRIDQERHVGSKR